MSLRLCRGSVFDAKAGSFLDANQQIAGTMGEHGAKLYEQLMLEKGMNLHGEDDLSSGKVMFHIMSSTDLLAKYLDQSRGEFNFDAFCGFSDDWIVNEAQVIESFDAVGAYNDPFCFSVLEYQGIYFVAGNEFDNVGFFVDRQLAEDCARDMAADYQ